MNQLSTYNKLLILVIFIYVTPLIGGNILILNSGQLIGDFTGVEVETNIIDLLFIDILYLVPFLISLLFIGKDRKIFEEKNSDYYINFYMLLIIANTLVSLTFGVIPVGQAGDGGLVGIIQAFNAKLNPYILLILISGLKVDYLKFLTCCLLVGVISIIQKSSLGFFVIFIAMYTLVFVKNNLSLKKIVLYLTIPIFSIGFIGDVLIYLYELKNSSRGFDHAMNPEMVLNYALGRINSLSSLFTIYYSECCGDGISNFYVLSTFLERITSLSFFEAISPTYLFNNYLSSDDNNYAIFTSMTGSLIILLRNGFTALIINIMSLIFFIIIIYKIMPFPNLSYKPLIFLLVFYLSYLSGDVWEISLLFQSFIILKFLELLYFFSKRLA